MADETFEVLVQIRDKLKGLEETTKEFTKAKRAAKSFGDTAKIAYGNFIGGIGVRAFSAARRQLSALVGEGFRYMANVEQQTIAISKLVGGLENAKRVIAELEKFAARTPFRLEQLIQGRRNLEIFTKGAITSETWFTLIGDAAAGTAQRFEDVTFWVGRLYASLENGDPIGESTLRLMEMGIIGGDVRKELEGVSNSRDGMRILGQAFSRYAGSMDEQSESLNGRLSTMQDNISKLSAAFVTGATGGEDLNEQLEELNDLLSDEETLENLGRWGSYLRTMAGWLGKVAEFAEITGQNLGAMAAVVMSPDQIAAMEAYNEFWSNRGRSGGTKAPADGVIDAGVVTPGGSGSDDNKIYGDTVNPLVDRTNELSWIEADLAKLESDQLRPAIFKREEELALLERKADLLRELAELYDAEGDRLMDAGETDKAYEFYDRRDEARTGEVTTLNQIAAEGSTRGQFTSGLAEWMEDFQTFGDAAAALFTDTLNPLVNDFGTTFVSTMREGGRGIDAVKQAGMQMLDNFIAGVINYGMQWMATQLLIKTGMISTEALSDTMRAKRMAKTGQEGAFNLVALLPGAVAASISSFGVAAIIGLALLAAAIAAFGGFEEGGYTGGGGRGQVAGFVHGQEYVMPAQATAALGVPALEYMRQTGRLPDTVASDSAGGGGSVSPGESKPHRTILVDDRRYARRLAEDPEFETVIVDVMRRYRGDAFA